MSLDDIFAQADRGTARGAEHADRRAAVQLARAQAARNVQRDFAATFEQWVRSAVGRLTGAGVPTSPAVEDVAVAPVDPAARRSFRNRLFGGSAPAAPPVSERRTVHGWPIYVTHEPNADWPDGVPVLPEPLKWGVSRLGGDEISGHSTGQRLFLCHDHTAQVVGETRRTGLNGQLDLKTAPTFELRIPAGIRECDRDDPRIRLVGRRLTDLSVAEVCWFSLTLGRVHTRDPLPTLPDADAGPAAQMTPAYAAAYRAILEHQVLRWEFGVRYLLARQQP